MNADPPNPDRQLSTVALGRGMFAYHSVEEIRPPDHFSYDLKQWDCLFAVADRDDCRDLHQMQSCCSAAAPLRIDHWRPAADLRSPQKVADLPIEVVHYYSMPEMCLAGWGFEDRLKVMGTRYRLRQLALQTIVVAS